MSAFNTIKDILKRWFVSGALVIVPLILTYAVMRFFFELIDGILSPLINQALGYKIPGLGIMVTIFAILLAGFFTRSLVGRSIYKRADHFLTKAPIIRIFYLAAKQLIEAITVPNTKSFKEVVLIEYMRKDLYAIGFATTQIRIIEDEQGQAKELVGIFIPSTPTPISGVVVFLPRSDVHSLDLTVEEALKLMVSGGIVSPDEIGYIRSKGKNLKEDTRTTEETG